MNNLTLDQQAEFTAAALLLIKWLNENCNPHVSVLVDSTSAELLSSVAVTHVHKYLKD